MNNGSSWPNAWTTIQAAVSSISVQGGDKILVGQGVYKPSSQSTPINLRTFVSIQGGYAGVGAADPNARDIDAYPSILSGDLGDNDNAIPPVFTDNATRVVRILGGSQPPPNQSATDFADRANLDGFTIRDAYTTSSGGVTGGGVFAATASPPGTSAIIRRCKITDNRANNGGGVSIQAGATVTFRQCEIYENDAVHGIAIGSGSGGGIHVVGTLILLDCWVHDNEATAAGGGGIVFASSSTASKVVSSIIEENVADENGGGIFLTTSTGTLELINSLLVGNISAGSGGAIAVASALNLQMTNCTVSGNSADTGGGVYYASSSTASTIKNSIFWDNAATISDPEIRVTGSGTLTISYSDIEGGWSGAGNVNINVDPEFVNASAGDYRIACDSDCVDMGDPDADDPSSSGGFSEDTMDVDENGDDEEKTPTLQLLTRIFNGRIDMGAYEASATSLCVADVNDDCVVNVDDLLAVINAWGPCTPCPADVAPLDSEGICADPDGVVDVNDLLAVINQWGPCLGSGCVDTSGVTLQDADDCMEAASLEYEAYTTEWDDYVTKCTDALRAAGLIE